jgi:hypothetical protein
MQGAEKMMSNAPNGSSEYDAIARMLQHYVDGGKYGRSDQMKAAFHPDATIFGYIGADRFAGPIHKLFNWNDQNDAATELQAQIADIETFETIATVRLELDNWSGHKFTDSFTLLKTEGEWKIISKVFHLHSES